MAEQKRDLRRLGLPLPRASPCGVRPSRTPPHAAPSILEEIDDDGWRVLGLDVKDGRRVYASKQAS